MGTLVDMVWIDGHMTRRTPATSPLYAKITLFTISEEWCSGSTLPTKPKVSNPHLKNLSPHCPLLAFWQGSRLRILSYKEPLFGPRFRTLGRPVLDDDPIYRPRPQRWHPPFTITI
ncbi:hypothetical protein FOQG_08394 [Fusarium oxysporum f. sp. raphani 54005]|uniref:Uncharacterized protein n=4 Tax=Fusarium oxysporum TaxID=5507 RepID=X0C372_FUSOX|nr:hypothetical protein FOVG_02390 [Fusarium oxysporum f. sp. pisi HDV247]EXK88605.1 hypothetical protein FOQG_08394 [Fusarium oxysporum f. sp. raphani 54005]EXL83063.1 hypothetical protein FOPG_04086 [Fusarium oxysporum f. sp. conglutinans race 2 54008]EXM24622.1 hypothetical protein FOTG_08577 [Fusarium oxysporum f. sp. vasinfectum 25433]KAI8415561.1 hypothetical protein FOFC_05186 [Fusarium oxysporum]